MFENKLLIILIFNNLKKYIDYERLCRSLNKYAKTTQQMKLLWGMILKKTNKKVDLITSSLVTKTWNELCKDKKYSSICNFEDSILTKIENTIKQHSKKSKQNQLQSHNNNNTRPNNSYLTSPETTSQSVIIPSNECVFNENIIINQCKIEDQKEIKENFLLFNNNNNNNFETQINNTLSPYSSYSSLSPISPNSSSSPITQNNEINYPSLSIEYPYQNENQIIPIYYNIPTQQTIFYY